MKVCIAGGSGQIGTFLKNYLEERQYVVAIIGRKDLNPEKLRQVMLDSDVFINLMGESIDGRWSKRRKSEILLSRTSTTSLFVDFLRKEKTRIRLMVNASAVGLYAGSGRHTEDQYVLGDTFLSKVAIQWEKAVQPAEGCIERVIRLRLGIVLHKNSPVLFPLKIARLLKLGVWVSTEAFMPMIHIWDVCRIVEFVIHSEIQGPVNAVLPESLSVGDFYRKAFDLLNVKSRIRIPTLFAKLFLGSRAELLFSNPNVCPEVLLRNRFDFHFPNTESVLNDLLVHGK